jgi:hypothetical protein
MGVPSAKDEFPPLLTGGAHTLSVNEIRNLCVIPFALSKTRGAIMDSLDQVIASLEGNGVVGELWVDGSFVTRKIDPADADVVLRCDGEFYENGTAAERAAIDALEAALYLPLVDSYHFFEWPAGHPFHLLGQTEYDYWWSWYTESRGGEAKGLAVVKLGTP